MQGVSFFARSLYRGYNETPYLKGTAMTIKKKIATIKTKLKEHSSEIAVVASIASAAVALAVAYRYKHLHEQTDDDCHGFAKWVEDNVGVNDDSKKVIWKEGSLFKMRELDHPEEE